MNKSSKITQTVLKVENMKMKRTKEIMWMIPKVRKKKSLRQKMSEIKKMKMEMRKEMRGRKMKKVS